MGKLDQMLALGRPQIGRMVEKQQAAPSAVPVLPRFDVTKKPDVTKLKAEIRDMAKRGRKPKDGVAMTPAKRKRLSRERQKAKPPCNG